MRELHGSSAPMWPTDREQARDSTNPTLDALAAFPGLERILRQCKALSPTSGESFSESRFVALTPNTCGLQDSCAQRTVYYEEDAKAIIIVRRK